MMKVIGWFAAAVVGIMLIGGVATFMNVVSTPGRVVSREVETDRAIGNYEWFFDYNSQYQSRVAQLRGYEKNPEITAIEVESVRQACRELANDYNAQSAKLNKLWFKDKSLPDTLDVAVCEVQQ